MHPVLFHVGPYAIRSYSIFLLLGMIAGYLLLRRGWREAGLRPGAVYGFCAGAIVSALLGGRLSYVLLHWQEKGGDLGRVLPFWQGEGEAACGAIVALLLWTYAYGRRAGLNTWHFFDLLVPAAAMAEGIMRWGCFLNGCCYGRETSGMLGAFLPDIDGSWAVRYPTQLLYSTVGLTLFAFLWKVRKNKPYPGFLVLTYVSIYSASRAAIGLLRGDYATSQGLALFFGLDLALLGTAGVLFALQVWRSAQGLEPSL